MEMSDNRQHSNVKGSESRREAVIGIFRSVKRQMCSYFEVICRQKRRGSIKKRTEKIEKIKKKSKRL